MALDVEQEDSQQSMVAATASTFGQHKQVEELKQQVKEFTTQVASLVQQQQMPLSAQQPPTSLQCCFTVIKDTFNGIVLNVKAPIAIALHMVSQAMLKRVADRETTEARPCQAAGTPFTSRPN